MRVKGRKYARTGRHEVKRRKPPFLARVNPAGGGSRRDWDLIRQKNKGKPSRPSRGGRNKDRPT